MEHLDFRKRVRFSAPEYATSPESELLRRLVSNLKKLDDLGLADDYIKRAVLEKFSRESNGGEFGQTLHAAPPIQFDVGNSMEGARSAPSQEPNSSSTVFANPIAKEAFEQALKAKPEKIRREVEAPTSPAEPANSPVSEPQYVSSNSESMIDEGDNELSQAVPEQFLRVVTDNAPVQENLRPEARIPKTFQVM